MVPKEDEKNQVVHSNCWLTLKWTDEQMKWRPVEYDGVEKIRVPVDKVWLPDIVLFNNADGNYEVKYASNVVVSYTGEMLWVPPTLYLSSCIIDVHHFPFDRQTCTLNFGSWTYDFSEVRFSFDSGVHALNVESYKSSSIWDLEDIPAEYVKPERRDRLKYTMILRRKPLFYTVVLIIPTVLMALMSMMTFYLPTESGEKISLATSILLSLVVFMLLMVKILPPSSKQVPLMAKFLLLVFTLNVATIATTVYAMNIYWRGPSTHSMSRWTRWLYFRLLATIFLVSKPTNKRKKRSPSIAEEEFELTRSESKLSSLSLKRSPTIQPFVHHPNCVHSHRVSDQSRGEIERTDLDSQWLPLTPEAYKAIEAVEFVAYHLRRKAEDEGATKEWRFAALILDKILMYIFTGVTIGGSLGIIFSAPETFVYFPPDHIAKLQERYFERGA